MKHIVYSAGDRDGEVIVEDNATPSEIKLAICDDLDVSYTEIRSNESFNDALNRILC